MDLAVVLDRQRFSVASKVSLGGTLWNRSWQVPPSSDEFYVVLLCLYMVFARCLYVFFNVYILVRIANRDVCFCL